MPQIIIIQHLPKYPFKKGTIILSIDDDDRPIFFQHDDGELKITFALCLLSTNFVITEINIIFAASLQDQQSFTNYYF